MVMAFISRSVVLASTAGRKKEAKRVMTTKMLIILFCIDNASFPSFAGEDVIIHPEHTLGDSRFDFMVESGDRRFLIEVKGVTQEHDGVCMFPDAPTERGLKHLRGLDEARALGYETFIALIVQMKGMHLFVPNRGTHPEFADTLREVVEGGTGLLVLDCIVTEDSMSVDSDVPFDLSHS